MKIITIILFLIISFSSNSQSIVGTWKRISSVLEHTNGKTDDMQKNLLSSMPCIGEIKYVFESNGKHTMILSKGCEGIPSTVATWKMSGDTFSIAQKLGNEVISTTYELSFAANIMTMTHTYTAADKAPDMKRIILKYQKI
jgi:hypothetical protein